MKQEKINKLLEAYYKGETTLQEEAGLREEVEKAPAHFREEDLLFNYYKTEAAAPDDLEEKLFAGMMAHETTSKPVNKIRWLKYVSVAAAVCLFASVFWFTQQNQKHAGLSEEQQFAVLEQALMQVSFGVQPPEKQEVLLLFQDDNLEIVVE